MALQNQRIYTSRHNYTAFYLDWSEEWISDGSSNYSNISWRVGVHASGATVTWYSNAIKILSSNLGGNGLTTGTWSNITISNGASVQLGNGGFNYGHDSAGNASIGGSIQGWLYGQGNTSTASGSWGLTWIPRYATITGTQGNFTDESTNVYISYSNPAGGSISAELFVRPLGSTGGFTTFATRSPYGSGVNFNLTSGEIDTALAALAGATQGQVIMRINNSVGNTDIGWENQIIMSVVNANPTFTTYTYKDNNSAMSAITGSDQVIVQNPGGLTNPTSDLLVTVTAANKAIALKQATMTDYLVTLGAYSDPVAYSSSSTVTKAVGAVSLSGAQTLQVRARDSRGNYTQVNTGLTVLPYAMPVVNATLTRSNNFDAAIRLTFTSIQISSITVGGVDKNGIKSAATSTANRIEYRFKTNAGSYSSWTDRTATVSAGSGGVSTVTAAYVDLVAAPTASNTYTAQVRVTDKLGNSTVAEISIGSGQPIFRIGVDGFTYNNEQPLMVSHVGQMIMSTSLSTVGDVAAVYGGTWVFDHIELPYHRYAFAGNGGYTQSANAYTDVNVTERYDYGNVYSPSLFTAPFLCVVQLNMTTFFEGIGGGTKIYNIIPSATTNNATAEVDTRNGYPQDATVSTQFLLATGETGRFVTYNQNGGGAAAHVTGHIVADLRTSPVSGQMNVYRRTA